MEISNSCSSLFVSLFIRLRMLWSVHSVKLHELFLYWHPTWYGPSTKQSLTNWIVHRSTKHSLLVHNQRKILVTLSESQLPPGKRQITQKLPGKTLLSTAASEATLTQPSHSLSQTQFPQLDMKDASNVLNEDDEFQSKKRQPLEIRSVFGHPDAYKKIKTEESDLDSKLSLSAYEIHGIMQQSARNTNESNAPSTSSMPGNIIPSQDNSGLIDRNVYCLEKKAEIIVEKVKALRIWDLTSIGHKNETKLGSNSSSPNKLNFKLMTYNILAQDLLEMNSYLYHHCDGRVLNWSYRCKNLLREIIEADSDILCFQEMQCNHYEQYFKPEMAKLGYDSVYKKRTGDKNDGCSIFYRKSAFSLEFEKSVEFHQPSVNLLDRDNIALIAVFRPVLKNGEIRDKEEDPKLCVATTHLLFNPRRGDVKLAQLQMLLAELDKLAFQKISKSSGKPVYHPVILCGDMNSEPYSPLYKFVTRGRLNYYGLQIGDVSGQHEGVSKGRKLGSNEIELSPLGITTKCQYQELQEFRSNQTENKPDELTIISERLTNDTQNREKESVAQLSHSLLLESAYDHNDHNGMPYVTTHHLKACCTVDYIFYSHAKKSPKHKKDTNLSPKHFSGCSKDPLTLLGTYRLLSYFDADNVGGLPNASQSSDHISLIAKFQLRLPSR